jgi:cellulose synthase operon protein C
MHSRRFSIKKRWWLVSVCLPWLVLASQCAPKTPANQTNTLASASASSSANLADELANALLGKDNGTLRADDDGLPHGPKKQAPTAPKPKREGLQGGLDALAASEYDTAKTLLEAASKKPKEAPQAWVGLAELALEQGKYADAITLARKTSKKFEIQAAGIQGRAYFMEGKLKDAIKVLEKVKNKPKAFFPRILLGEIYLRQNQSSEADSVLNTFVQDFNDKKITPSDPEGMMWVGRATHLLRSKKDANESFDDAEKAGNKSPRLFMYRAQLFLEAYNYGRAQEMVISALKSAPNLPEAHILMANIKLAQALDFVAAERHVKKALAVNPNLPEAFFIRAGISLRDMEIGNADKAINHGLSIDPSNLELLSLRAAARFLDDDTQGYKKAEQAVLDLNGKYAKMYQIISSYAEWEHRYRKIAEMMQKASGLAPEDGQYLVNLGLNQIRLGEEQKAVPNLQAGFDNDPFNIWAFNTLNLYEKTIPQKYETVKGKTFNFRYPKNEKAVLERYVPGLMKEAWNDMRKRYGFTPTTPVWIEIYHTRQDFSIRTSGLPNIGIQGVCFGETLAAISPGAEPFNWGMVLWHELGHVFAIQLSKNHVPRWFTEGLSEYETIARRPEWQREEDVSLYHALKSNHIPKIDQMNRVFTHSDSGTDITTAYYASSQIAVFLVEKYGMPKLVNMLKGWGQGKKTPEVIQQALGVSSDQLDEQFRGWVKKRLSRYETQFVPDLNAPPLEKAEANAKKNPKDPRTLVELCIARLQEGKAKSALAALDEARKINKQFPDVRFVRAKLLMRQKQAKAAEAELVAMTMEGNDGYAVRMMLADLASGRKEFDKAQAHFEKAAQLDPSQAEPLQALVDMARKRKQSAIEFKYLKELAKLDQHDRRVWRRLLVGLIARKQWAEAVKVGESAMFVDIHGSATHTMYGEALLGNGDAKKAIFEAESALLCKDLNNQISASANMVKAKAYKKLGQHSQAKAAQKEALRQDPSNADAKAFTP